MNFDEKAYAQRFALVEKVFLDMIKWPILPCRIIGYFPFGTSKGRTSFSWKSFLPYYTLFIIVLTYWCLKLWINNVDIIFKAYKIESNAEKFAYLLLVGGMIQFTQACRLRVLRAAPQIQQTWKELIHFTVILTMQMEDFIPLLKQRERFQQHSKYMTRKIKLHVTIIFLVTLAQFVQPLYFDDCLLNAGRIYWCVLLGFHTANCQLETLIPMAIVNAVNWLTDMVMAISETHPQHGVYARDSQDQQFNVSMKLSFKDTETQSKGDKIAKAVDIVRRKVDKLDRMIENYNEHYGFHLMWQVVLQIIAILSCLFLSVTLYLKLGESFTWSWLPLGLFCIELYVITETGNRLEEAFDRLGNAFITFPVHGLSDDTVFKVRMLTLRLNTMPPRIEPVGYFRLNSQVITAVVASITTYSIMLVQFQFADFQAQPAVN